MAHDLGAKRTCRLPRQAHRAPDPLSGAPRYLAGGRYRHRPSERPPAGTGGNHDGRVARTTEAPQGTTGAGGTVGLPDPATVRYECAAAGRASASRAGALAGRRAPAGYQVRPVAVRDGLGGGRCTACAAHSTYVPETL